MTNDFIRQLTASEREQERIDFAIASEELKWANNNLQRTLESFSRSNVLFRAVDASVALARARVTAAETVILNLDRHYANLRRQPSTGVVDVSDNENESDDEYPITDEDLFFAIPSSQLAGAGGATVDPVESVARVDDPSPPYTSQPGSPSGTANVVEHATSRRSAVPPDAHSQSAQAGQRDIDPPSTPRRNRTTQASTDAPQGNVTLFSSHTAAPSTPSTNRSYVGTVLTSPSPMNKHYIVTRGRRTGIYTSWYVFTATYIGM